MKAPTMNRKPTRPTSTVVCAAAACLLAGLLVSSPARAHITIATPAVAAGSYAKVVLQVPHGCAGRATTAITVTLPAGFYVAKPQPKPGWTVTTQKARLAQPIELHGRQIEESVSQIRWEGGPLPNDFFDEFALQGKLGSDVTGPLAFKTLQSCEQGEAAWTGEPGSSLPAPLLQVTPAPAAAGTHHHQH